MTTRLVVLELPSTVPQIDDVSIGFVCDAPTDSDAALEGDCEALLTVLASGATRKIDHYYHPAYSRATGACTAKTYDITGHLDGSPHGSPVHVSSFTLGISGGAPQPPQLAAVVDFHGDLSGVAEFGPHTRPRARRRGRHFHGALTADALVTDTASPWLSKLDTTFTADLVAAYHSFLAASAGHFTWSVWSRKDAAVYPIVGGWIDSLQHVQRRRLDEIGTKTLWS